MNPIDEYLESDVHQMMEKKANLGTAMSFVGKRVGTGALEAAGGAALLTLGGAAIKAYKGISKKRDFRGMMEANPDLQEYQGQNPKQFQVHYNSFRNMNPSFASDPVVAGTYMRQMSMSPETAGKVIVESLGGARALPPSMMDQAMSMYRPTDPHDPMQQQRLEAEIAERRGKTRQSAEMHPLQMQKARLGIPQEQERAQQAAARMRQAAQQMQLFQER